MGRMVFLTGEAGIGKSRLASELADEARARGATVLAGRAVPTSASIPYRPLTEALLHALRERTFPDDPALTPWLPALQAMIPTIAGPGGDGHGDHAAPIRGEAVLPGGSSGAARVAVHLKLAHAAVDGTRWAAARRQLGIAGDLLAADPHAGLAAGTAVLNAEVAFADNDIDTARALAESALASPQASPQVRCHALELLGRVLRGKDLDAARDAFEQALATADASELAVWRLRALHQLGTIDMFDDAVTCSTHRPPLPGSAYRR